MNDLPAIVEPKELLVIQEKQTQALEKIGDGINAIATFLNSGGLTQLAQSMSLASGANSLLNGLTAHAGRNGLDARTLQQNATEIAEAVLLVHNKFKERLEAMSKGEVRSPDIQDSEADYKKWKESEHKTPDA